MDVNFFDFQRATSAVIYFTYHAYLLVAYLVQASFIKKYFTNYKVNFSFIIKSNTVNIVYSHTLKTVKVLYILGELPK